jgi:hypothetical protein
VTVAVEGFPPTTVEGFSVRSVTPTAGTVKLPVEDLPLRVAVIPTVPLAEADAVAVNVAEVAPPAIVTVAGTVTCALADDRATVSPPDGAALVIVTVPVVLVPVATAVGKNDTPAKPGALTVRVAEPLVVPRVAETLTDESVATASEVTVKVADEDPPAIVTDAGTVAAAALSVERLTERPPLGACPERVTVAVEVAPPVKLVGLRVTEETPIGFTVKGAEKLAVPAVAVMFAVAALLTTLDETLNVAEVAPDGMTTVAGTDAATLSDFRFTANPADGAALDRVTVPVALLPPRTEEGDTDTAVRTGAVTDNVVFKVVPLKTALIVTVVFAETGTVVTPNVAELAPATTVTVEGTTVEALSEVRLMSRPPVGATPFKVIDPVAGSPPTTLPGLTVTAVNAGGVIARVA